MDYETLPPMIATILANTTTKTTLAPGFGFHPTDKELVGYYLKRKVTNKPFRFNIIKEIDIYKIEPWDLPDYSRLKTKDQEWYFFSVLDKKYRTGARMNRTTGKGYWKATGRDREIRQNRQLIGLKKSLVFYYGHASDGQRTNWIMHEYRLVEEEHNKFEAGQNLYVLCKVFHKNNIGAMSGNQYAPFIRKEWGDSKGTFPGEATGDDQVADNHAYNERNNDAYLETMNHEEISDSMNKESLLQTSDSKNKDLLNLNELPTEAQNDLLVCNRDRDDSPSLFALNTQTPLPLQYKRQRQNDSDPLATATISPLLECSLMEPIEPKESTRIFGVTFPTDSSVLPSYVNLINDLTVERETLKLEMKNACKLIR
uniref:NAC transcription factor 45 n=1 Tax=Litchi chinensis TaxID=151069 RepID=A0A8K1HZL2_LITCN|nr:NAC transcription factor 45 [Litchi chinensis]